MEFIGAGSSILGGLLGGAFRLVPELFKFLDAKNERAHELAMQDKQLEFAKLQGQNKIQEAQIQQETVDIGALRDVLSHLVARPTFQEQWPDRWQSALVKGKRRILRLEQLRGDTYGIDHILKQDPEIYDWWKNIRSD